MNFTNLVKLIRPNHWIKNFFVFIVPILHFKFLNLTYINNLLITFVCFCLFSSAGYVLNDWFDRKKDIFHPLKKSRPFASCSMKFFHMVLVLSVLLILGFILLFFINGPAKIVLLIYLLITILYTLFLKSIALVDIVIISFGFVLRLYSGSISTNLDISIELLIITFLLCLFLPLSKRRDDIILGMNEKHRKSLNFYNKDLIDNLLVFCLASFFSVFILWSINSDTATRLGTNALPLLLPFILISLLRYMQFIFVLKETGDPVIILFKDKFLQINLLIILLIFILIRTFELDLNNLLIF